MSFLYLCINRLEGQIRWMSLRDTSFVLFVMKYLQGRGHMLFQIRFVNVLFQYDKASGVLMISFWYSARTERLLIFFTEKQIRPTSVCTGSRGDGSVSSNVTFLNNIITPEGIASNTIAYSFSGIGNVYLF